MFRMKRVIPLKLPILWCISPLKMFDEVDDLPPSTLLAKEMKESTGWDRLRMMFTLDEYKGISPEIHSAMQAGFSGMFFGALYGGFIKSRMAYLDFFEQNQATAFRSHMEAKKVLQDYVTVNFAKGAFSWGWRLGIFSSSLVLVSTAVSVYRGKSGIIEYSLAGCVSGSLFRTNLGIRGMIVGGLLGTALGTVGGCLIFGFLKAIGMTMEDLRNFQYKLHEHRTETKAKLVGKELEEPSIEGELIKHHDTNLEQSAISGSKPKLDRNN